MILNLFNFSINYSVVTVYCILIAIIGLFGNGIVLYFIKKIPKMQTITNKFIANLVVADLLFIINFLFRFLFCMFIKKVFRWFYKKKKNFWFHLNLDHLNDKFVRVILCKIGTYGSTVFIAASNYTLVAISIERCMAIKYPHLKIPSKWV